MKQPLFDDSFLIKETLCRTWGQIVVVSNEMSFIRFCSLPKQHSFCLFKTLIQKTTKNSRKTMILKQTIPIPCEVMCFNNNPKVSLDSYIFSRHISNRHASADNSQQTCTGTTQAEGFSFKVYNTCTCTKENKFWTSRCIKPAQAQGQITPFQSDC